MSNPSKPVAVIILNWNGASLLRRYLPSVLAHTPSEIARVIVADNGSSDSSLEILNSEFPMAEVMSFDRNYGFAEGYNRAIEQIDSPYVVLLNSDVEVADDWLTPMYRFMEENPDFGAIQPKLLSALQPEHFEYAGAMGGYLDHNGYPYCRGRIFDTIEKDSGQYDLPDGEAYTVDWASGAALMVRRDAFIEAGGLDPKFFAHMEEIDLCWRIRLAGLKVGALPSARVFHLGGGSLPASNPRKTYLNFRNNLLMLHKNLPDRSRSRRLLIRRLLDTIAWARYILMLDTANASAIWNAHRDFAQMRREYTQHPTIDLTPASPNILTHYYLKGNKLFSMLPQRYSELNKKKTNMEKSELKEIVRKWIINVNRTEKLPSDIVALCIIIQETAPYGIELIGSKWYDKDDDDWACDEDFIPTERDCPGFEISDEVKWQEVLEIVVSIITDLVNELPDIKLFKVDHIAVGFSDGDLIVIK